MKTEIELPLTLFYNLSHVLLLLASAVMFACFFIFLSWCAYIEKNAQKSIEMSIIAGLSFLPILLVVNHICTRLIINDQEFIIKSPLKTRLIRWDDTEGFDLISLLMQPKIIWNYTESAKPLNGWRRINRHSGYEDAISASFGGMKPDRLVTIMNNLRSARQSTSFLTIEQKFELGLSAIIFQMNGLRHDCIFGGNSCLQLNIVSRDVLVNDWGIKNSDDLQLTLRWLNEEGHNEEYSIIHHATADPKFTDDPFSIIDPDVLKKMEKRRIDEYLRKVECVVKHGEKYEAIYSWDLCRLIAVARFGAASGYISEKDAWVWIHHAALKLRATVHSWYELDENYAVGREFSIGKHYQKGGKEYAEAREFLLNEANSMSPWNQIPWHGIHM